MKCKYRLSAALFFTISAFVFPQVSYSNEYQVTIEFDENTDVDLSVTETFLGSESTDMGISGSMRRVFNGALGEAEVSLEERVADDGSMVLDDGSLVYLMSGDKVAVIPKRRTVIVECEMRFGIGNKLVIPACSRICGKPVDANAKICNSVPPRKKVIIKP